MKVGRPPKRNHNPMARKHSAEPPGYCLYDETTGLYVQIISKPRRVFWQDWAVAKTWSSKEAATQWAAEAGITSGAVKVVRW